MLHASELRSAAEGLTARRVQAMVLAHMCTEIGDNTIRWRGWRWISDEEGTAAQTRFSLRFAGEGRNVRCSLFNQAGQAYTQM